MSKTVLIVDDGEDVRMMATFGLEAETDWAILAASSGQEALTIAAEQQPDVILLDMMMPGMDGRTTLQHLKQNPVTQQIPVILVTAKIQPSNRADFADLDVVAVLAKPFRPLQLASQIRDAIGWN